MFIFSSYITIAELFVFSGTLFSFSVIFSTPYPTLSERIIKVMEFLPTKGYFPPRLLLLSLSCEFSYSSIIFPVKILIQFVACVCFLWGLVVFSQIIAFLARERSGQALFFLWLFLCINIKSLCLNRGFYNFWSDVFLGTARQYSLSSFL